MLSINSYDLNTGGGYGRLGGHPSLGTTAGQSSVKHLFDDYEEEDYEELDHFVDRLTSKKIKKLTDTQSSTVTDIGARRDDAGTFVKNVGGYGLHEFATHTNTVSKGLSPRLTYRGNNTKGPALGTQSAATYIRSRPGRKSGTQFGTSRAPRPKFYEDDENIWSLSDIGDPHDRALKRQNKIRKFIFSLEEA